MQKHFTTTQPRRRTQKRDDYADIIMIGEAETESDDAEHMVVIRISW